MFANTGRVQVPHETALKYIQLHVLHFSTMTSEVMHIDWKTALCENP